MRRINNLSKVLELFRVVYGAKLDVCKVSPSNLRIKCEAFPPYILSRISSNIRICVYPFDNDRILIEFSIE